MAATLSKSVNPRIDQMVRRLHQRRHFLLLRRESYTSRIRVLTESRANLEITGDEWVQAVEDIYARLAPLEKELGEVDASIRSARAQFPVVNRR